MWQGNLEANQSVLIGSSVRREFVIRTAVRKRRQIQNKKKFLRVPYHKLLNNLARSRANIPL